MDQHQIKMRHPLLDEKGRLIEAGYAKELLMDYDRSAIKAGKLRIKEWDYYLIACDDFAVALTIADNSYMGLDSISLIDFRIPWERPPVLCPPSPWENAVCHPRVSPAMSPAVIKIIT